MTTSERWRRVEALYHAALQRPPGERTAFLRVACADDAEMRLDVESLLAQPASDVGFLQTSALAVAARAVEALPTTLTVGQAVGPYTILGMLGAGGMGEVYRASDGQLGREVAIKLLPPAFLNDPDRLARFEREKRMLAALNHPNIAAIYTVEPIDSGRALVLELVEGPTLADRLERGPLPLADALRIATQIVDALEAAHEKGIVHRDLKPANIKLRPDGSVKVLDFGLAKAVPRDDSMPDVKSLTLGTTGDRVIGTPAYMSPEQARGQVIDKRTDIWAFGCVLFEMLTGRAAFAGATVTDTLAAIIEREPDWTSLPSATPSAVRRLLRRCLEKDAQRRLHDIADARLEIEEALAAKSETIESATPRRGWPKALWVASVLVAALAIATAGALFLAHRATGEQPRYRQITFRRGTVRNPLFAPDGQTIVFGADWEGRGPRLYSTRIGNPEVSPLPFENVTLLSISSTGQMALRLNVGSLTTGTLAVASLTGQAVREILTDGVLADWSPNGETLLVIHRVGGGQPKLEVPPGTVIYDSGRPIYSPRFSPKGDAIAFIERNAGVSAQANSRVAVVDLAGHVRVLSEGWSEALALAWAPGGQEIWFSAREPGSQSGGVALHAVTLSGRHRVVARLPGVMLVIRQIWSDGRVLLDRQDWPATMMCLAPGMASERDLSWLDESGAREISTDGRSVLFDESGTAGGAKGGMYLRRLDGSPAVRLSDGRALGLSPDGKLAIALQVDHPDQLEIVPTGTGQPRVLRGGGLTYLNAVWFPDGKRLLVTAQGAGQAPALFVQSLTSETPRRLLENAVKGAVSPDGRTVATVAASGQVMLTPVDGGQSHMVNDAPSVRSVLRWDATGRYLFLQADGVFPARILRLDIETGLFEPWRTLAPADMSGILYNDGFVALSADGRSYCYSYVRYLSSLFVVEGLK